MAYQRIGDHYCLFRMRVYQAIDNHFFPKRWFLQAFYLRNAFIVAGQIAFISFHLHGSISVQCNFYLAHAFADAEVEIFQLLASEMQHVKLQLFLCLHERC